MSKRQYPRQAWVLLPSFKPKEVTIERVYSNSVMFKDFDVTNDGKSYHAEKLYSSLSTAIAAGREHVARLQADIERRQETLKKRIVALDKAEKGGAA